jgi:hypothetical protein
MTLDVLCQVMETSPNSMLNLPIVPPTDDPGNANLSLSDLEIFCLWVYVYLFNPISDRCISFVLEVWKLILTSHLSTFISLDLMLLPNMTGSDVNLSSSNYLDGRKSYMNLCKNSCSIVFDN